MNIIIIISATFRYDNLFDRAEMRVNTPSLDRFSERAVSLSRSYTGSFPTIPHRTDLISGRFGWPWYGWQELHRSTRNALPRVLGEKGYVSQLICDCPHLFAAGFQRPFHAAQTTRGQEGDMPFTRMNYEISDAMPREKTRLGHHFRDNTLVNLHRWTNRDWKGEEDRFPPRTASLAAKWLEENYKYEPFFLWIDFFDPHEPWDPPEYMVRKYDPDYDGTPMIHPNYGRASDYTQAELWNLRAHYCAEAELVDRWVGRVLQKIDDLDLWKNSIVVFTTDHGMSLGEHNRTGKSNINERDTRHWPVFPEISHIPLLIAAPCLDGGSIIDIVAQPADIWPTLLDLVGVQVEPPEPLHGLSFAPQLLAESSAPLRDVAVTARFLRKSDGVLPVGSLTPVLHADGWAYVPVGPEGNRELYDTRSDPYAQLDVAAAHPDMVSDLHERLLSWLTAMDAPPGASEALD